MKHKSILSLLTILLLTGSSVVMAGGHGALVPYTEPGSITIDGTLDSAEWANAVSIDLISLWEGGWHEAGIGAEPTVFPETKLFWTTDTLFVGANIEDADLFTGTEEYPTLGDEIFICLAPDYLENMIYYVHAGGIELGIDSADLADGYVRGAVRVWDDSTGWSLEIAIYEDAVAADGDIAFTMAGEETSSDPDNWNTDGLADGWGTDYAWYMWHPEGTWTEAYIGKFWETTSVNGFLKFVDDTTYYGGGHAQMVTYVAPGTLTLDGVVDEEEWATASPIDLISLWEGGWHEAGIGAEPTVFPETRLLFTDDTLFVSSVIEAVDLHLGTEEYPTLGDELFIAIDNDSGWNSDIYYIQAGGFELGLDSADLADGFVRGGITINEDTTVWSLEIAIYNAGVAQNGSIGFTMAGEETSSDPENWNTDGLDEGWGTDYAWYMWHPEGTWTEAYIGKFWETNAVNGKLLFQANGAVLTTAPNSTVIPEEFGLRQNYPNPFNPTTQIVYDLSRQSNVELVIYNLLGEKVATLVSENQPMGTYTVTWNAGNFASGMYFSVLNIDGNLVDTKRMVLLK